MKLEIIYTWTWNNKWKSSVGPNISHNTENLFCVINQDFFFFFL